MILYLAAILNWNSEKSQVEVVMRDLGSCNRLTNANSQGGILDTVLRVCAFAMVRQLIDRGYKMTWRLSHVKGVVNVPCYFTSSTVFPG